MTVKKLYYLFFYRLYLSFKPMSDGLEVWKACSVLSILSIFLATQIFIWLEVILRLEFTLPKYSIGIVFGGAIVLLNYYALLYNNKWKLYEDEFKSFPSKKNKLINVSLFFFSLLVILGLIFAYYCLGKV